MEIYFIISIAVITTVFYALRKYAKVKICASCAGIAGTWILALIAKYFGYPVNESLIGILMGGSVVGIMYQAEKKSSMSFSVLSKSIYLTFGFAVAYGLLKFNLSIFVIGMIGAIISYAAFGSKLKAGPTTAEIEKRMKENCCD